MPAEEPVAPYTGRTSPGEVPPVAAPTGPRIPWRRIAAVQIGAGFLAGLVVPGIAVIGDPQWIPIALISGFAFGLVGGGLPLAVAAAAFYIATRNGRDRGREISAVVIGALIGALPIGLLIAAVAGLYGLVFVAIIGIASAVGFAIWVLVAWAPHAPGTNAS